MAELENLQERFARMEDVLAKIAEGDLQQSIKISDSHEDAFTSLEIGVNFMVADLRRIEQARAENEAQLLQQAKELQEKLQTIDRQRVAIRALSTPLIEIWQGVLCLPVVGALDSARSTEMSERLLHSIQDENVRAVIIDITGIDAMDTQTANHFVQMANSVRLLGARAYITGISPHLASTLNAMGVDLQGVQTLRSPKEALQQVLLRL